MDAPSEAMKALAQRLLAVEAASEAASDRHGNEAIRVCEKLRISLTRFAGADGFAALMGRALVLAREEVTSLQTVTVKPDGSIVGLDEVSADANDGGAEATVALTGQLLSLLVIFIGERLTLRLVADAWPHASLDT